MTKLKHQPPKLALKLFRWYCRPDRLEELEGDLIEFYNIRLKESHSPLIATIYCWWNVLRFYRSYARSGTKTNGFMTSLLISYLKLNLRHSWKNKGPVTINVLGLGLALSMCVFVYTLYAFNFEFDSIYSETKNVYKINAITSHNGEEKRNEFSPIAMDNIVRNDIAGITNTSSFFTQRITVKHENDFFSENAGIVSTDFMDMFDIPLQYGSLSSFGMQPTVYLSQKIALKYFGSLPALNEKLTLYLPGDHKVEVTIAGVVEDLPLNSSFQFDILFNQKDYLKGLHIAENDWSSSLFIGHYIELTGSNKTTIESALNRFISLQNERHNALKVKRFELIPFHAPMPKDMIIGASYINARLKPSVLVVFTSLALMTFLIACFNLANTSMALVANRLKEIGVRKTLGSGSRRILIQFLFEMGITSVLAFIVAIATSNIVATLILKQLGASFLIQDVDTSGIIVFIIVFLFFTTLVAGLFPALYAWRFEPVAIMKKTVKLKGINWLNKILTVSQYGMTITVLVASFTFAENSEFIRNLNLGYVDEHVFNLPVPNEHFLAMKQEIDQIPGVASAGAANHFGNFGQYSARVSMQIDSTQHELRFYAVDLHYLDLMELVVIEGRNFSSNQGIAEQNTVLVSQTFVDQYLDGKDAINREIKIHGKHKTIVGVTADIIDDVVKAAQIMPMVIGLANQNELQHLVVKVINNEPKKIEKKLVAIWKKHIEKPYRGIKQEDFALGAAGKENGILHKIFLAMAVLSGFLSGVGLYSLAKLNVAKRIKELSIRKVLGASTGRLLIQLNRPFLVILFIALLMGSSLGIFLSNKILDTIYRFHVEASLTTSLMSGLGIAAISILMISFITFKNANSNPVSGLKE